MGRAGRRPDRDGVQRLPHRPEPVEKLNALPLAATTLSLTGLEPSEVCFVVRSVGEGITPLESTDSGEACAIPEAVPAPNAPTNLAAAGGERQITLTWQAPVGEAMWGATR